MGVDHLSFLKSRPYYFLFTAWSFAVSFHFGQQVSAEIFPHDLNGNRKKRCFRKVAINMKDGTFDVEMIEFEAVLHESLCNKARSTLKRL